MFCLTKYLEMSKLNDQDMKPNVEHENAEIELKPEVKHENVFFKCEECPKVFETKRKFSEHMRSHTKVECPKCEKVLSIKFITQHICPLDIKLKIDNLLCDICNFRASTKNRLVVHLRTHVKKPKQKKMHFCQFSCDYKSDRKYDVRRHETTCRTKTENFIWF